jgi:hypothetical protein
VIWVTGPRAAAAGGYRREVFEGAVGVDHAGVVQGVEHKPDGDRVFVDVLVGNDHVLLVLLLVVVLRDHVPGALGSLTKSAATTALKAPNPSTVFPTFSSLSGDPCQGLAKNLHKTDG